MAETTKKNRGQWFREMKSELKKVIWPDKKTVMKNTGTVLLCSLLIGVWRCLPCRCSSAAEEAGHGRREVVCRPYLFRL